MNTFGNWTDTEVAVHNNRVALRRAARVVSGKVKRSEQEGFGPTERQGSKPLDSVSCTGELCREEFGASGYNESPAPLKADSSLSKSAGDRPARAIPQKDLHEAILEYCKSKRWYVVHSRMDRRTSVAVGTPDFCIAVPGGRVVWLECKRKGGKPSIEQQAVLFLLRHLGHTAQIVHNWPEALAIFEEIKP